MYYVILITIVSVSGGRIPQMYSNEPNQERYDRPGSIEASNSKNHRQNEYVNNHEHFNAPNNRHVSNDRNFEIPFGNSPLERDHRNLQENFNHQSRNEFMNSNNPERNNMHNNRELVANEAIINDRNWSPNTNQGYIHGNLDHHEQLNAQKNREFVPNGINNRNRNLDINQSPQSNINNEQFNEPTNRELITNANNRHDGINAYQGHSRNGATIMSINLGFDKQGNQNTRDQSNLNIPRQSFNVNNGYSNTDDTNRNLQARRQQDEMALEDYNRETQRNNHRNNPGHQNNGIVPVLNNLNNTERNRDSQPNHHDYSNQSGFKQNDYYKPKTANENEVTPNPQSNGHAERMNRTHDGEWVWGVAETTTLSPVTVDDRAAFSGDKCPKGLVKFHGKCVTED